MIYLYAFLIAGIWSAVFQGIYEISKQKTAPLLCGGFILGGLLSAIGVMDKLNTWGGAGNMLLLPSGGAMVEKGIFTGLGNGDFTMAIAVVVSIVSILIVGFLFGAVRVSFLKKTAGKNPVSQDKTI